MITKGKQFVILRRFGAISKEDITAPFKTRNRCTPNEEYIMTLRGVEHTITEREYAALFNLYDSIKVTIPTK